MMSSATDFGEEDELVTLAISPVRNLGDEIGWQTAMYLSAERTMRKRLLVIWLMEVVVK